MMIPVKHASKRCRKGSNNVIKPFRSRNTNVYFSRAHISILTTKNGAKGKKKVLRFNISSWKTVT